MRARHLLPVGMLCAVVLAWPVVSASATNGAAMQVDVHAASISVSEGPGGSCAWVVTSRILVINLQDTPSTVEKVAASVSWTGPASTSGVVTAVAVDAAGGLVAGTVLAPDVRQRYDPFTVSFSMPCDATFADLAVSLTTPLGTGSGDAPVLTDGSPLPMGAVGVLGGTALAALGLGIATRRRSSTRGALRT